MLTWVDHLPQITMCAINVLLIFKHSSIMHHIHHIFIKPAKDHGEIFEHGLINIHKLCLCLHEVTTSSPVCAPHPQSTLQISFCHNPKHFIEQSDVSICNTKWVWSFVLKHSMQNRDSYVQKSERNAGAHGNQHEMRHTEHVMTAHHRSYCSGSLKQPYGPHIDSHQRVPFRKHHPLPPGSQNSHCRQASIIHFK